MLECCVWLCRDVKVERLDVRVVEEVAAYGGICRTAKDELRRSFDSRKREIAHRHDLEKTKSRHPQNRQQIVCVLSFQCQRDIGMC